MEFVKHLFMFFRFCVLVAGFMSRTQGHKKTFNAMIEEHQTKVSIPTLHVFGDTDRYSIFISDSLIFTLIIRVIEKEMSEELLPYFENVDILRHSGGHFVPATGEQKKAFVTFFEKMQESIA